MAAPLAGLHIALILRVTPSQLVLPLAKEHHAQVGGRPHVIHYGRAFFQDSEGLASPDGADIIFDPWMHAGFVAYGDSGMIVSGPDLSSVVYNWLPRAQAGDL